MRHIHPGTNKGQIILQQFPHAYTVSTSRAVIGYNSRDGFCCSAVLSFVSCTRIPLPELPYCIDFRSKSSYKKVLCSGKLEGSSGFFARDMKTHRRCLIPFRIVSLVICSVWMLLMLRVLGSDFDFRHRHSQFLVHLSPKLLESIDLPKNGLNGRMVVFLSKGHATTEPRKGFSDEQATVQAFGIDVTIKNSHQKFVVDKHVFGFPKKSIKDLAPGNYTVQAQMMVYEEYHRENLAPVLLPKSCINPSGGNGAYDSPIGTLFSTPLHVMLDDHFQVSLEMDSVVKPSPSPGCAGYGRENSEFIKTFRWKSELLTKFWGKEMVLEACVLLPFGWSEHPNAKYPLIVSHGHYSAQWAVASPFEETEPTSDPNTYDYVSKMYGHYLYKNWTSTEDSSPFFGARMIVATINHPTPFFDDSYAGMLRFM
jgi:hypothetical protein